MSQFVKDLFSARASASMSRMLMAMIVLVWLNICTYLAFKNSATVDIPIQWAGLVALLYGLNKFSPPKTEGKSE